MRELAQSLNNFRVIRLDGTEYNMRDVGVFVGKFIIDSPQTKNYRESIEGRSGFIDLGTEYEGRTMRAEDCSLIAVDNYDYSLLRNEIFRIFDSREAFYIVLDREPGKRWLVKYDGKYSMSKTGLVGKFSIDFTSPLAYAESLGTTLDPLTFDEDLWQFGQGLTVDDKDYTQSSSTFSIYNAGDIAIDPRELPLKITYTGASTNLSITNDTTGDAWSYTGSSVDGDTITIDGVKSQKNAGSIFKDTNKQLITLDPGWNDFTLAGTSGSFTISFDFRFYTL